MNLFNDRDSFVKNFSEIANYGGLVLPRTVSNKTIKNKLSFTPNVTRPLSVDSEKLTVEFERLLLESINKNVDGGGGVFVSSVWRNG